MIEEGEEREEGRKIEREKNKRLRRGEREREREQDSTAVITSNFLQIRRLTSNLT